MDIVNNPLAEAVNLASVKKRSLIGVVSLVSRSFLVQVISFGAMVLLTIYLEPKIFGLFYIVSAIINFFAYFSDVGLAAALIQKKDDITDDELKSTFTLQQLIVISLLLIILLVSPLISNWYKFTGESLMLLYALVFSFFLSSLKTIPSVILERKLLFNRLIIPQILETIVFNIVAVFFAWRGFGITSFTYAVLARGIVGLVAMYLLSPWKIGLSFSFSTLRSLLSYGIPYQANTILAVLKDDLMTIILGKIIGPTGVGYIGWAKKWAEMPLRFFMDNVLKVTFPAFSRLQGNDEELKKSVEKSLFFLCILTFPILIGFSIIAADLVQVIPRYLKWQPALIPLYLYCVNSAWATVSTTMTNLLNSIGKIKTTFKLMLMWLVLTWLLMPALGIRFGYQGIALAAVLISVSSLVAIIAARRFVGFNLFTPVIKPLIASGFMGIVLLLFHPVSLTVVQTIIARVAIGFGSYCLFVYLVVGDSFVVDVKKVLIDMRRK